jgi:excisionase family DNA binding protein
MARGYLTVREIAAKLKISVSGVYSLVRHGTLPPPLKFGKLSRWSEEQLEEVEQQQLSRNIARAEVPQGSKIKRLGCEAGNGSPLQPS